MKIAITGHRPNKLGNDYELTSSLIQAIKHEILLIIEAYYPKESLTLITGMALGIDTLFAKIAIEHKIPFIAVIPFIGQHTYWLPKSKIEYMNILKKASVIYLVDEHKELSYNELDKFFYDSTFTYKYDKSKLQLRNIWMVDNCDILIAVHDGSTGGTYNCVEYAKSKHKTIHTINPKNYVGRLG